jgi:hypothetical protein
MDLQLSVYHKLISMKDKTMKMHHWLGIAVTGVLIAIGSITTVSALPIPPKPTATRTLPPATPQPTQAGPQTTRIPAPAAVPNFPVNCASGQVNNVDPIVMPGMAAMSHYHQFFGNRSTNENSTFTSLRANRATTCAPATDASAYWVPQLWRGSVAINPKNVTIVYSKSVTNRLVPHPGGLMLIAGNSKATAAQDLNVVSWYCSNAPRDVASTPPLCARTADLIADIRFPECWNGKDLDSADHKSHVTYAVNRVCAPGTVALPRIDMLVRYPAQANVAELAMSSGSIYSMHADFFNAWDPAAFARLVGLIR